MTQEEEQQKYEDIFKRLRALDAISEEEHEWLQDYVRRRMLQILESADVMGVMKRLADK